MKRCPTCQRTFADESLSFCTEDGTPLWPVEEDETTRVTADQRNQEWNAPPYQPPRNSTPVPTQHSKNAPWILVLIVALVLGVIVGVLALGFLIFPIAHQQK